MRADYTPSYIAFLDILGFKMFVKNHGFIQIREIFEHIGLDEKLVSGSMIRSEKGLIDAYLAQENISVFPRIIIADKVLDKGVLFVDDLGGYGYEGLPQDKDGYHYINTLGNWLLLANCGIPIRDGVKYKKLYQYINSVLSDYSENKLRQKYLWLQSELERAADTAERARTNI